MSNYKSYRNKIESNDCFKEERINRNITILSPSSGFEGVMKKSGLFDSVASIDFDGTRKQAFEMLNILTYPSLTELNLKLNDFNLENLDNKWSKSIRYMKAALHLSLRNISDRELVNVLKDGHQLLSFHVNFVYSNKKSSISELLMKEVTSNYKVRHENILCISSDE